MKKYCIFCGQDLDEKAIFCHVCGKKQKNTATVFNEANQPSMQESSGWVAEELEARPKKPKKKGFAVNLIRNSVLLAVAITLFVLSFAPIFKWKYKDLLDYDDFNLSVSHSVIDGITYLFDSMKEYDEMSDSSLYDDYIDGYKDIFEIAADNVDEDGEIDIDDLSSREKKKITDFLILTYRIGLQTDNVKTNVSHTVIAIVSILYVLLTLTLLVFAIINFISSFGLLNGKRKLLYNITISLLGAIPAATLVIYSVFFSYMGEFGCNGVAMGSGAVATLVISLITVAALITLSFIFDSRKPRISNIVLRSISTVLAILVLCMCFTPLYTATVEVVFDGKSNKSKVDLPLYASIYEGYLLNETELKNIEEIQDSSKANVRAYFAGKLSEFKSYQKRDVEKGAANELSKQYFVEYIAVCTAPEVSSAISAIGLLYIFTVIAAGILLQQNFAYFIGSKYISPLALCGKILTIVFASFAFVASIAVLIGTGVCVTKIAPSGYSITLGAGLVFMLIFAITTCCIPSRVRKEK